MSQTHREAFGSRCTDTDGSSFVPVQIPPDFSLSHLLEEISTYFLKIQGAGEEIVSGFAGLGSVLLFVGNFFRKFDLQSFSKSKRGLTILSLVVATAATTYYIANKLAVPHQNTEYSTHHCLIKCHRCFFLFQLTVR